MTKNYIDKLDEINEDVTQENEYDHQDGEEIDLELHCGYKKAKYFSSSSSSPSSISPPNSLFFPPLSMSAQPPSSLDRSTSSTFPFSPSLFEEQPQIKIPPFSLPSYYETLPPPQMPFQVFPNKSFYFAHSIPEPLPHPLPQVPSVRVRVRARSQADSNQKVRTITPPYPWATDRPAVAHNLIYLVKHQILTITGMVRCNKCEQEYEVGFNLEEKVMQISNFVSKNKEKMFDRAPEEWLSPTLLSCKFCTNGTARPIFSENKDTINWLFLFLGQLLGCCTLDQLKYFCACTFNHRTGAKDRVLYLAYHTIYKQLLDPDGPFDSC